jgi:LmbE family N-acetylglucosaminyl deacetylase
MKRLVVAIALTSVAIGRAQTIHPPADSGAALAWLTLLKTRTTASLMQTTAHPDDEQGGMLAMVSRGEGARVSLLTVTRGESGDNAIGPELFDALGLIRTEELLDADAYYGVDRQYFTTVVDYGFSKRLDEALEKWGRERVLRDVVRIIRRERPLVLVARFQGNSRDGHGNHQAAGLITQDAYRAAGDPSMFPELAREGLVPWQARKLYMGGVRENEEWNVRIDAGRYDPVLGDTYQNSSRLGLAFQRSQNSGRTGGFPGSSIAYYKRLASTVPAPEKESGFFEGIDTRLPPAIDREIASAMDAFTITNPAAAVPALTRALTLVRDAARQNRDYDAVFALGIKERQIQEAIVAALGVSFTAVAQVKGPVVPGQTFEVKTSVRIPNRDLPVDIRMLTPPLWTGNGPTLTVPADASPSYPYFRRSSIQDSFYTLDNPALSGRPADSARVSAVAVFRIDGVPVDTRAPVTWVEPTPPHGEVAHVLGVLPVLGVTLTPSEAIVPLGAADKHVTLTAEIVNNRDGVSAGDLTLILPAGWTADPTSQPFQFDRIGARRTFSFRVAIPTVDSRAYRVEAVANSGGREFRSGYQTIAHRDLETRYLPRDAVSTVRGVDVRVAPRLKVGYVMGIGDEVPAAIAQLGGDVRLLGSDDLRGADLGAFDTIVTGTRAYAVRDDLKANNARLLEYVREGGNLVVLYNTQELVPRLHAPFPGELPRDAEEVSEEDSPVEILAPDDPALRAPNRITKGDFDGWVEQRGSKFWSSWDPAYTPIIATWDRGQAPQRGGWLHARVGRGHYTYFAYALHRQLPYGVPGAYRLLANLLSLGKN